MNGTAGSETRLMWPGLRAFYDSFADIAYTLMRVVVGYNLLMHGWVKVSSQAGAAGVAGYMARQGLEPGAAFAYAAIFLETVGAVCIIVGLLTRFFAAALAIEMADRAPGGASGEGIRGRRGRLRIRAADRHRDVLHRHPRRRALLGRSRARQGAVRRAQGPSSSAAWLTRRAHAAAAARAVHHPLECDEFQQLSAARSTAHRRRRAFV